MKIFAAVLALVLIAGSQGSPLLQAKAQTKWEEALERFWSFTTRMTHSTQEMMNKIQSTELDKHFQELITNCMAELNVSADDLRSKLGPYTERFNADVAQLQERLNRDLTSVQSMLMIYNEEAHLMVEQNANDVRQTLALYLRKYRKRVNRDREEIKRKFHEYKDELATKGQRSLDELREMMEPYARAVGDKLQERFADIHQTLSQQAEEVRSRAEDLQGQVAENTEGLRVALTRRMEEIRTWFETEARQVSERFTELFDSLRQQEVPAESL